MKNSTDMLENPVKSLVADTAKNLVNRDNQQVRDSNIPASETECGTLGNEMMLQSDLHGDMEKQAEMPCSSMKIESNNCGIMLASAERFLPLTMYNPARLCENGLSGYMRETLSMSRCQSCKNPGTQTIRREVASMYPVTKESCYVVGAYLGDGYVVQNKPTHTPIFCLKSIDREFPEYIRNCLISLGISCPEVKELNWKTKAGNPVFFLSLSGSFASWLKEVTEDKKVIPSFIPRSKSPLTSEFINGYLDAEGYVSKSLHYRKTHYRYQFGFCGTEDWVDEIAKMLILQGMERLWKSKQCVTVGGLLARAYRSPVLSAIKAGVQFRIIRKQNRMQECAATPQRLHAAKGSEVKNLVKCGLCGKEMYNLYPHIRYTHQMELSDYRNKFPGLKLADMGFSKILPPLCDIVRPTQRCVESSRNDCFGNSLAIIS